MSFTFYSKNLFGWRGFNISCFIDPSQKTLVNGWNSLQKIGYMKYTTWLIMIEAWQHGLALLNAPSAELFAQAYRSPSLSSSSYFSWVAHSLGTRMPSYAQKLGKARKQGHKYYTHTSPIHLLYIIQVDWIYQIKSDHEYICSFYDNENKELFKLHDDYLQCSQLWTSKVPTSSMSHRPCQWPWYQQLPASATVLPTEAPYPKRRGTSMKGPDCEAKM